MSPTALPSQAAAVLHGPKDLRIEDRTVWPPAPSQVQVAIAATGLCGSDLHYYLDGRNGDYILKAPLVLGHESAGTITAVGSAITNLVVGQRVAIEAGIMCRNCDFCNKGRYNLCKNMKFCSSASIFPHLDGTLQTLMNHPAHVIHPLPDTCSFDLAALAEPLSVIIHASRRANLTPGRSVLVFGVGTIGALACALATSIGASLVAAVDINKARLDFSLANGFASQVHCIPEARTAKTTEEQLRQAKQNAQIALEKFGVKEGFDIIFECTGAESCIQMSIHSAVAGGQVVLIGMGAQNPVLPLSAAALREVDIQGSFRYANTYEKAVQLLSSGRLQNVEKLITHRFPLSAAKQAFEILSRGHDDDGNMVLKVMVASS